jgi:hypothetical protein
MTSSAFEMTLAEAKRRYFPTRAYTIVTASEQDILRAAASTSKRLGKDPDWRRPS